MLSSCFLAVFFAIPYVVPKQVPSTTDQEVSLSATRELSTAARLSAFIRSTLDIEYTRTIRVDQAAKVVAVINQLVFYLDKPNETISKDYVPVSKVETLQWPIHIVLTSEAFDFSQGDADRPVLKDTHLPFRLEWGPVPKKAGDWIITINLKDLNGGRGPQSHLFS
jgi:hypothetical protein